VLTLVAVLAGCATLPRGAAIEREVLAVPRGETADFTVEPVTRARLAVYAAWPDTDADGMRWIERVEQPANRIIAPGDTITTTIWNTEDNGLLTGDGQRVTTLPPMRVSPDGSVFMPYVGSLRIAGMSPEHARAVIEERYREASPSA